MGEVTNAVIHKTEKRKFVQKETGKCNEYTENDSKHKCVIKQSLELLKSDEITLKCLDILNLNISHICWIPQMENMLRFDDDKRLNLTACTTHDEYICMLSLLDNFHRNENCINSCIERSYEVESKHFESKSKQVAILVLSYQSNTMTVLEEYLVFDLVAIISAIGGNLGLFLGFSFFQCCTSMASKICTLKNRCKICKRSQPYEA